MHKLSVSVVVCTHNPKIEYLQRVLNSIKNQTLNYSQWELLIIDNASAEIVADKIDLSWHPYSQCFVESKLGLTPARLRGIDESKGNILVFVDDDNVLKEDYLENATHILENMPFLGAIGGQILPEYEILPPEWLLPYESKLAIRRVNRNVWSNNTDDWQAIPWGAGLVIRKNVCEIYASTLQKDPHRQLLDRRGDLLISGGDTDMVLTCSDVGLGFGVFQSLEITHLISKKRLSEEYIIKLIRGLHTSSFLLPYLRREPLPNRQDRKPFIYKEIRRIYHLLFKRSTIDRKIEAAINAGEDDFDEIISELEI